MDKKLQVFVSSTYMDLVDERQMAVEGILRSGHIPAGMELFIPSNKSQWEIIKEWIKDSDILVLILGGKYGSIEPESEKSYTHLEYEFAIDNNIPVFSIVLNPQFLANKKSKNIQLEVYEQEVKNPSLEKYQLFKHKVMTNLVSIVENCNQISTEITLALNQFLQKDDSEYFFRGWIRGSNSIKCNECGFNKIIEEFLDEKRRYGLSQSTIDGYRRDLRIFSEYFYELPITRLDTSKIKEFLSYRQDNYIIKSKNTMERIRGNLHVFFDWLLQEEVIRNNPVSKVKPYKYHRKQNVTLDNLDLIKLRDSCETVRERAILEVFLSTGCKLSELQNIYTHNINWLNKTIRINLNDKERITILTPKAEKYLKLYLEHRKDNSNYLFVTERKPYRLISKRAIQDEIFNITKRAGITKHITTKTLRYTFSKRMLEKGFQINIVECLLGYTPKGNRSETYYTITEDNIWGILGERSDL